MEIPPYVAERALERLRHPHSAAKLRRLLNLLEIDPVEPQPGPDFEHLTNVMIKENPENASHDSIVFSGELSILGVTVPLYLRISYAGEFGRERDDLSYVSSLDVLCWEIEARSPQWKPVPDGALDAQPFREALTELVIDHEAAKAI